MVHKFISLIGGGGDKRGVHAPQPPPITQGAYSGFSPGGGDKKCRKKRVLCHLIGRIEVALGGGLPAPSEYAPGCHLAHFLPKMESCITLRATGQDREAGARDRSYMYNKYQINFYYKNHL